MKLKSFGCSFIFGTDLSDNPESLVKKFPVEQYSRSTWPALLAKKMNCEYDCLARPGSGNLQIAERVLNSCAEDNDSFYVINWTWIDRFDFIQSTDMWQPWGTIMPNAQDSLSNIYYKQLHSEYRDKLTSLMFVNIVIDKLLQKEINFIMTYEDKLLFDHTWHCSPAIKEMQNYCINYMFTFNGMGFLEWSKANNYKISDKWHPLEEAHEKAAELVFAQKIIV